MDYPHKRSSSNFAKKIGFNPILPNHLVRSKRTQEAIKTSQEFYKENITTQKLLLEKQLSYKEKEAQRPPVEKPSNIVTLQNDTQWTFDKKKNKFVNIKTGEELDVGQYYMYTTMVALDMMGESFSERTQRWGINYVIISPSTPNANGIDSVTATPIMYSNYKDVSFTYRWTYDSTPNPLLDR